ncbi:MAG: hypothetical protein HC834_07470 [Rhodospirillales bacterium]|nr:hypothetical protein [Rhodospirillales bacterium]
MTRGPNEAILKANLRTDPHHHRALATFLEAMALWEGRVVRAALVADDDTTTSGTSLFRDCAIDRDEGPLFSVDVVWDRKRQRTRDGLGGLGDFRDLQRLIRAELSR